MRNAHAPRIARCTANAVYALPTTVARGAFPVASGSSDMQPVTRLVLSGLTNASIGRPDSLLRLGLVDAPAQTDLEGHVQPGDVLHLLLDQGFGRGNISFRKVLSIAVQPAPKDGYFKRRIYCLQSNMDNFKIILRFWGVVRWNHIIYDLNEGRFVSITAWHNLIIRRLDDRPRRR